MEKIIRNPGLQHLAEKVFWNLDVDDLKICAQINQSCEQMLQNPIFCLSKFENLSKKNQRDWLNAIQSVKNSDKGIAILSYLKWNLKRKVVEPPCYSNTAVQDGFREKIWKFCKNKDSSHEDTEIVKILVHLTDNPNASDEDGSTPIHMAALSGCKEIVKILAPLTDNPNVPNNYGKTPIFHATNYGHTEIVKILAPLTDNSNAPNKDEITPILLAAKNGHTEIIKILAPLTDNPNAPNKDGKTPSSVTKNAEIQRYLKSINMSKNL